MLKLNDVDSGYGSEEEEGNSPNIKSNKAKMEQKLKAAEANEDDYPMLNRDPSSFGLRADA